jgi:hypothetical protein
MPPAWMEPTYLLQYCTFTLTLPKPIGTRYTVHHTLHHITLSTALHTTLKPPHHILHTSPQNPTLTVQHPTPH